ncbi:F-box protein At-B-like [Rutidosis leptorrhynchoides]|uniref:F-box protein At-B-like n=1 Tax=Rutidosis leptorrhynchoides TaxID=125765 RepID=UPI003A98D05E
MGGGQKEGSMDGSHSVKAQRKDDNGSTAVSGVSFLESLPENIFYEILIKSFKEEGEAETMLQTLCSAFSLDSKTFVRLAKRLGKMKKITLNCLRLNNVPSIKSLLGPDLEELVLVLTLEISGFIDTFADFDAYISILVERCRCLEALHIKAVGGKFYKYGLSMTDIFKEIPKRIFGALPKSIKVLKIEPVAVLDNFDLGGKFVYINSACPTYNQTLTNLSLVLNHITNPFLHSIANCLPLLVELDLEDNPAFKLDDDMSDEGVQSLIRCRKLTSLSLKRLAHEVNQMTDVGILLLSEGCKGLISVRLGGFSRVSDVGFTSILNSCSNLKKFEIQRAPLLTDLTFQDVSNVCNSLVEVKLEACNSVTSKAVRKLTTCSSLEVVDLIRCESVGDTCLDRILWLTLLTSLNLEEIDVTDSCIVYLGKGNAPISRLSLRGCKRVTDKGITLMLGCEGKISKFLSFLDLGEMPGITDNTITTVAEVCMGLTELCIRKCFHVTNASVKALATKGRTKHGSKLLRKLDLYQCTALSAECFEYMKKPLFCGLQWFGIGKTQLIGVGDHGFNKVYKERPWFTICTSGCEVGCHDRWEYHKCHKASSSYV